MKHGWYGQRLTPVQVLRSLCLLDKRRSIPLQILTRIRNVNYDNAKAIVNSLVENCLVCIQLLDGMTECLSMHDVMHDMCVHYAQMHNEIALWHGSLVDSNVVAKDGSDQAETSAHV